MSITISPIFLELISFFPVVAAYFSSVFDKEVYAGDYHRAIRVGNFLSPGCLIQSHFGDSGLKKGFWTRNDDVFEFHQSSYPEYIKIEIESIKEIKGVELEGNHMWFVTSNKRLEKKLYERCEKEGSASCKVSILKQFTSSHEKVIEISGESEMFDKCLEIRAPQTSRLQAELFQRICINDETYAETIEKGLVIFDFLDFLEKVDEFEEVGDESVKTVTEQVKNIVAVDDIENW